MNEKEDTSTRIKIFRKRKLEQMAIEIGYATKTPCKWTDILNYLIDNYANEAKSDLVHKIKGKDSKKQ
ncbi:hypothetical protein NF320_004979 [Salmonella enterica]|nr:hypothetical protein [Salmonella enterica]ECS8255177.1 hypothetical protein [Salmonella enterica subsp. enterica serovar Waycross]EAO1689152.1 hypothetical protein [Salmonella enterica]EAP9093613.1 hypothetical protein [Salmonella enterica]EAR8731044.1 hypothetical protein [Salmonella enterica]